MAYKTPGVYVKEVSTLPASVAQVETAIPAFIGYTQFATEISDGDLNNKGKRIKSLVEYEQYFGKGPEVDITDIVLDGNNALVEASMGSDFKLYDSIRLFFANGGGPCWIISVGDYDDSITKGAYIDAGKAFDVLKKIDEPTMIVTPDAAAGLGNSDLAEVQQQALLQCGTLMDRVGVLDLKDGDTDAADFRSGIGINNLSYGAAYTPWLRINSPKTIGYSNIVPGAGDSYEFSLSALSKGNADYDNYINMLEQAYKDSTLAKTDATLVLTNSGTEYSSLDDVLAVLLDEFYAAANLADKITALKAIYSKAYDAAEYCTIIADRTAQGEDPAAAVNASNVTDALQTEIKRIIKTKLDAAITSLAAIDTSMGKHIEDPATTGAINNGTPALAAVKGSNLATEWVALIANETEIAAGDPLNAPYDTLDVFNQAYANDDAKVAKLNTEISSVEAYLKTVKQAFAEARKSVASTLAAKDDGLASVLPSYKSLRVALSAYETTVPPSGAIAGVYASVDNSRGVWKAPANVSINGVVGPTELYDDVDQADLNVDATAGKSVNAIRYFTGKGSIVWGARTLAGNDNEWRYISVRRFYNMVEESIKKSTSWVVFEPNDVNTWVRVRGQIENYLSGLWRDGALAGAAPAQAFFVNIGLGETMTSTDILEGRMIIQIGMAVVRPAEFIILEFSHKLQEA